MLLCSVVLQHEPHRFTIYINWDTVIIYETHIFTVLSKQEHVLVCTSGLQEFHH